MMNKVEGGFTTEKGVNIHNVLNSTCHIYKVSYSLLFRQTNKKQQGCGDRIKNGNSGSYALLSLHIDTLIQSPISSCFKQES